MAIFITNIKFSQQGIKDIDHTTKQAAIFKAEAKKLGAKVKDIYWTLGEHDGPGSSTLVGIAASRFPWVESHGK